LLKLAAAKPTSRAVDGAVWLAVVGPDAVDDPSAPIDLTKSALRVARGPLKPMFVAALGAAYWRSGRYQVAMARLEEAERHSDVDKSRIVAFLAMANQACGRPGEARRYLDRLYRRTPPDRRIEARPSMSSRS
jgi:tetratricopeptide (TPR) repeat protein